MTSANPITVILVDDHALVRRAFRAMLEDSTDIKVVAEASDGDQAIALTAKFQPNVLVMDAALPKVNGLDATKAIRARWPEISVLMLSMHSESTWVRQALDAGANGYVLKSAVDLDLCEAIRKVAAGTTVLDSRVSGTTVLRGEKNMGLTARELEILQHIVNGESNKEIAVALSLSSNTVAVHRANIMDRLNIHNTAELVVYAIKNGLVNIY